MKCTAMVFSLALIGACGAATAGPVCTADMAQSAQSDAAHINSFADLYTSFKRYRACDDGPVAGAYKQRIQTLLTQKWHMLEAAEARIWRDPAFVQFIAAHVDEDWAQEDLARVKDNALNHCPAKLQAFCLKVWQAADDGLKL